MIGCVRGLQLCVLTGPEAALKIRNADGLVIPTKNNNQCQRSVEELAKRDEEVADAARKKCLTTTATVLTSLPASCRCGATSTVTRPSPCPLKCVETCTSVKTLTAFE